MDWLISFNVIATIIFIAVLIYRLIVLMGNLKDEKSDEERRKVWKNFFIEMAIMVVVVISVFGLGNYLISVLNI